MVGRTLYMEGPQRNPRSLFEPHVCSLFMFQAYVLYDESRPFYSRFILLHFHRRRNPKKQGTTPPQKKITII